VHYSFSENKQKVYKYNHVWLRDSEKLKKEKNFSQENQATWFNLGRKQI